MGVHARRAAGARKSTAISFRIDEDVKAAIEKAARDDCRSISSYADMILRGHLRQKGYLQPAKRPS